MRVAANAFGGLSRTEIETIHRNVLRILAEVGMLVESDDLLEALAAVGGQVTRASQTVRFPVAFVERFLAESVPYDWETAVPHLSASAGVYLMGCTEDFPASEFFKTFDAIGRALDRYEAGRTRGSL